MTLKPDVKLHEVAPRESAGRDTISRFQAQFRAAGYACLAILQAKEIDRVYCDYQDDFVVRKQTSGSFSYVFNQVKTNTKRNHQWDLLTIFGIYKKTPKKVTPEQLAEKVIHSFAGKLLVHTINFGPSCEKVVLLTNVHLHQDIEDLLSDISTSNLESKHLSYLLKKFNSCFLSHEDDLPEPAILDALKKLEISPGVTYLNLTDHNFDALAKEAIYKYSEIDLTHKEAQEIIAALLSLVENKSSQTAICGISEDELEKVAGIDLNDLLGILSISKGSYEILRQGGDPQAIKTASILQRKLDEAGADDQMKEFCIKQKIAWDTWYRDKRHVIPEFDFFSINSRLNEIANSVRIKNGVINEIDAQLRLLHDNVSAMGFGDTLTKELLLGGFWSTFVRMESR